LEVFLLHGFQNNQPINYRALFEHLAAMQPVSRARQHGSTLVALRHLEIEQNHVRIVAYEGPIGEPALIYDMLSAEERIEHLAATEALAQKTHAMFSLLTQELVVEYNRRGAKASDIVNFCQELARQDDAWDGLDLAFAPVVEPSFLQALDRFRVIKIATVKVARPNQNWNADLKNMLGAMASDSDARMADVTLHAERRGTLSRTKGLIAYLRQMVSGSAPSVEGATVSGVREGENADSSISLNKYVQSQVVRVRLTRDGYVDDEDIESKIRDYVNSREHPPS
jgi:hypothetical protein